MVKNFEPGARQSSNRKQKKKVHVYFLLDESGSMKARQAETIACFNEFIQRQQRLQQEKNVKIQFSLTTFNSDGVRHRYVDKNVRKVVPLNEAAYQPHALTPLCDVVHDSIRALGKRKNVLFVILTDGLENASGHARLAQLRSLIREKERLGWTFQYLGVDVYEFSDARTTKAKQLYLARNIHAAFSRAYFKLRKIIAAYTADSSAA